MSLHETDRAVRRTARLSDAKISKFRGFTLRGFQKLRERLIINVKRSHSVSRCLPALMLCYLM